MFKKFVSFLLCMVMSFSLLCCAFAENENSQGENTQSETTQNENSGETKKQPEKKENSKEKFVVYLKRLAKQVLQHLSSLKPSLKEIKASIP